MRRAVGDCGGHRGGRSHLTLQPFIYTFDEYTCLYAIATRSIVCHARYARYEARFPVTTAHGGFSHPDHACRSRPSRLLHHAGCRTQDRR